MVQTPKQTRHYNWEKKGLCASSFIFLLFKEEEMLVVFYSFRIPMAQHGAVLQDNSYNEVAST
jgi:hypothetical protein